MHMTTSFSRLLAAIAALLLAASCGGGGNDLLAGIGSGGTGGIAVGPITGFGSVIVNGIEFDDTAAQVTIGGRADRPVSELKLGMVVEVRGTISADGKSGKADAIIATVAAEGPVAAISVSSRNLWLLGQRVRIDAGTVFEGFPALDALAVGDIVAVSGLKDASNDVIAATRIERGPPFVSGTTAIEIQGEIAALTPTTFQIGSLTINYAGAALNNAPGGGLANGLTVTVQAAQPPLGNLLTATSVQVRAAASNGTFLEFAGYVANFISASDFRVGTLNINAANAKFVGGTVADLAVGKRVEVEGTIRNGVLVASEIDLLKIEEEELAEVEGAITDYISQGNFKVRGQLVDATAAAFVSGAAANLANGRQVHVKGSVRGSVLAAAQIEFKDTMPPDAARLAVEGVISDFVSPANFRVNGQLVAATAATVFSGGTAADLANGRRVAAEGVVSGGILAASTIAIAPLETVQTFSTEGAISDFVSPARFKVNGQAVSANAQTVYVAGTAATLANGMRIAVTGTIAAGVLSASRIEFKAPAETENNTQVEGYITNFVSVSNFKVTGQVVDATGAVFENGKPADLANGLKVQATGKISSGVLKAVKIEISR
jgi:hypothetical protein